MSRKQLLLFPLIMMFFSCKPDQILSHEAAPNSAVTTICELAENMSVFPVTIIAQAQNGPLRENEKASGRRSIWGARYELTFAQYKLFSELKYLGFMATVDDLNSVVSYIDKATPKEKALILTMLYVYERTHRKPKDGKWLVSATLDEYHPTPPLMPKMQEDKTISRKRWQEWIQLFEKYSTDGAVVFPAIVTDEMELKKAWQEDQMAVCAKALDEWHFHWFEAYFLVARSFWRATARGS